jgi:hypothetical protein
MIFKKYIHLFLLFFWGTIIVLYLVKPVFNKYDSKDNNPKLIKKDKKKPKEKEDKKDDNKDDNKDDTKKNKKDDDKDKKNKNKKDDSKEEKKKKKEEEEKKKKKEDEKKKKKKEDEKKKKALTEDDIVEYDDVGQLSYEVITDDEDDADILTQVNINKKNQYDSVAINRALGIMNDNKRINENILKKSGYDEEEWYANIFKLNQSNDDKNIITINNYDNYKNKNL